MASSAMIKFALVVALCMVVSVPVAQALTCGQVSSNIAPCIGYVRSSGGAVPPACCNGIRSLSGLARTTADRQAACNCLKQVTGAIPGYNPGLAAGLPSKCGVNIPYRISPAINCGSVK